MEEMVDVESQILRSIKEILKFKDPDTIKASLILNRIRTILGLKDLASAPDLYEACKELREAISIKWVAMEFDRTPKWIRKADDLARKAMIKAEGK